ncbi:hypothetical protein SLITO_v1c06650 [Spiroplasma litorale]|uniref:Transmembrane protein n=1 Tax=Spiroplasma litorale TaxID=216942 RepID=A0A0K1W1V9_9MOLU|nr:hypothetical protein [Spiroplasma litorale]AKX34294.1 hypothetical protein SLITO_v1c06650 [Spiroplasma litorale]
MLNTNKKNIHSKKIFLNKKLFISLIIISLIYVFYTTIVFMYQNINSYSIAKQSIEGEFNETKVKEMQNKLFVSWIVQFISFYAFILIFVLYSLLSSREKVRVGLIFIIFWVIIFWGYAFAPIIFDKGIKATSIFPLIIFLAFCVVMYFVYKEYVLNKAMFKKQTNKIDKKSI